MPKRGGQSDIESLLHRSVTVVLTGVGTVLKPNLSLVVNLKKKNPKKKKTPKKQYGGQTRLLGKLAVSKQQVEEARKWGKLK